MQLAPAGQVGQRGVRKQQLARGEAAFQPLCQAGAGAKKSDLETIGRCVGRGLDAMKPSGGLPPLDARIEVGAEVAWEGQWTGHRGLRAP